MRCCGKRWSSSYPRRGPGRRERCGKPSSTCRRTCAGAGVAEMGVGVGGGGVGGGGGGGGGRRHQPQALAEVERVHIERTLRFHGGNRTRAAKELGISRATLINNIKAYGLDI